VTERAIHALLDARRRALHDRDAVAFLAGYAPDAVIFDLAPPLAHGVDPTGVTDWIATWDGPILDETRDVRIVVAGAVAHVFGLERLAGLQGGSRRDIWFRFTLCLERRAEGWRILHEHTSLPFRKGAALTAAADLTP
jgi:ketosteroid isomerase-like protein